MIEGISQILFQILAIFYQLTHNYGISIILFACAIKLILSPLTQQQFKSMKEMQAVQPEIQKLQARYKDDPKALNKALLDLYRTHKINPLAGCLPTLFQMPILVAIWGTMEGYKEKFVNATFLWVGSFSYELVKKFPDLTASIESWRGTCGISPGLKHKFLFWGDSLAAPDFPLLILYAVSMIFSFKLSPSPQASQDVAQQQTQKMMGTIMPVMLTFMLINTSSAFILYWLAFNVISIIHQYYVMKGSNAHVATLAGKEGVTEQTQGVQGMPRRPRKRGQKKEVKAP